MGRFLSYPVVIEMSEAETNTIVNLLKTEQRNNEIHIQEEDNQGNLDILVGYGVYLQGIILQVERRECVNVNV